MIITKAKGNSGENETKETEAHLTSLRALKYTNEAWFPANPETVRQVTQKIKDRKYATTTELLEDLRQDFAYFGSCLKEVAAKLPKGGPRQDLVAKLESMSLAELQTAIPSRESQISSHLISQSNDAQKKRLEHFFISSSAVSALARESKVSEPTALCAQFFRQVGYALICWNYPRIYARAIAGKQIGPKELDRVLAIIVGISPRELGLQLAQKWGAGNELLDVIKSDVERDTTPQLEKSAEIELIKHFCGVSEALARSQDPLFAQSAEEDASWVQEQITRVLGERGFAALKDGIRQRWEGYLSSIRSGVRQAAHAVRQAVTPATADSAVAESANQWLRDCPSDVRAAIEPLYKMIVPGHASPGALRALVEGGFARCGFHRGCIYLVEAREVKMIPHIVIGGETKDSFRPIFLKSIGMLNDPLTKAFVSLAAVKGHSYHGGETKVLYMAGPLGQGGKRGVLYLETSSARFIRNETELLSVFYALHQVLCQALCLKAEMRPPEREEKRKIDVGSLAQEEPK